MSNFLKSLQVAISKQDSLSLVFCGMEKALTFATRNAYAEKIRAGGKVYACMDGVSLYLEKNFHKCPKKNLLVLCNILFYNQL